MEQFECALCLNLLLEPISLSCGHTFCKLCTRQALRRKQQCPLCRVPIPFSASEAPPNVIITNLIAQQFPAEIESRRKEAEEEAAAEQASSASAPVRLHLFMLGDMVFPGQKKSYLMFEPRYIDLVQRAMAGSRCFGLQFHSDYGTVVHIEEARGAPGGRVVVQVKALRRYRVSNVTDDGGRLMAGDAQPLTDEAVDDGSDAALEDGVVFESARELVQQLIRQLPPPARAAFDERFVPCPAAEDREAFSLWLAGAVRAPRDTKFEWFRGQRAGERVRAVAAVLHEALPAARARLEGRPDAAARAAVEAFELPMPNEGQIFSGFGSSVALLAGVLVVLVLMGWAPE